MFEAVAAAHRFGGVEDPRAQRREVVADDLRRAGEGAPGREQGQRDEGDQKDRDL
jgi:hypothetical protein